MLALDKVYLDLTSNIFSKAASDMCIIVYCLQKVHGRQQDR